MSVTPGAISRVENSVADRVVKQQEHSIIARDIPPTTSVTMFGVANFGAEVQLPPYVSIKKAFPHKNTEIRNCITFVITCIYV